MEKGVEILPPKESFFGLVERKGIPTRRARFCCEALKEYKVLDRAVQGIRRGESKAREERYKEPEICRVYDKNNKVKVYLPLLDWTDEDVARFVAERGVQCHPLYYDEQGVFHAERRLGCIGCPLQSDNGKADYKKHPKLLKRLVKSVRVFLDTHPDCSSKIKFSDNEYNLVFHNLFCDSYDDYETKVSEDLWGNKLDIKAFLEDYFKIEL
jgi:phosphoadenosine phosphosulfate reductase